MRVVFGFLVLMVAAVSSAQMQVCSMAQIKLEARNYLVAADTHKVEYIQNCLAEAIKRDPSKTTRLKVLNVLADIKRAERQADMAALIKCETSGTPGCLPFDEEDEDEISTERRNFPAQDDLDRDADRKAKSPPLEGKDW